MTPAELFRLADRLSWIRAALRGAVSAETALRAISQDGPAPELHRHLVVSASDLSSQVRVLLKEEAGEVPGLGELEEQHPDALAELEAEP